MSTKQELIEISKYLSRFGDRWSIAKEEWVKEIIKSLLKRRCEIIGG